MNFLVRGQKSSVSFLYIFLEDVSDRFIVLLGAENSQTGVLKSLIDRTIQLQAGEEDISKVRAFLYIISPEN